jgi:hypothetical protein
MPATGFVGFTLAGGLGATAYPVLFRGCLTMDILMGDADAAAWTARLDARLNAYERQPGQVSSGGPQWQNVEGGSVNNWPAFAIF